MTMKKLVLVFSILIATTAATFAQKFAYVDTEYILGQIPEYKAAQAELDFLDDDSEITFAANNSETLNSLDVSNIGPNIVIPGGGVGLTPTGQVFSNSSENVLNNQKNVVFSNGGYVIEFIDKYIDDNNNKIC